MSYRRLQHTKCRFIGSTKNELNSFLPNLTITVSALSPQHIIPSFGLCYFNVQ